MVPSIPPTCLSMSSLFVFRLISPGTPGRCSRQSSQDESPIDRPVHLHLSRISQPPTSFDDLSPILEDIAHKLHRKKRTESLKDADGSYRRALFSRTISEPEGDETERAKCRLVRRFASGMYSNCFTSYRIPFDILSITIHL